MYRKIHEVKYRVCCIEGKAIDFLITSLALRTLRSDKQKDGNSLVKQENTAISINLIFHMSFFPYVSFMSHNFHSYITTG